MTVVTQLVGRWRTLFPASDEAVWKQWVDLKQREWRNLKEVVEGEYRESFKARALLIMLVPDFKLNPVYWKLEPGSKSHNNYVWLGCMELDGLPLNLLKFVADTVCTLNIYTSTKPREISVDDGEVALARYNQYLLRLLTLLPEDQPEVKETKERVFAHLSLRDPVLYSNMDTCSGYNPFQSLLNERSISDDWKQRADDKMRHIVRAEVEGQQVARAPHENAFHWYIDAIEQSLYGNGGLPYSVELLADQIKFVVSLPRAISRRSFSNWQVGPLLHLLTGKQHEELRHKLVRFVILRGVDAFIIYDVRTLHAAEAMMTEYGQADAELSARLQPILEQGHARLAKEAEAHRNERDAEAALLRQMK